ncbi:hypothetical protein AAHE18_15G161300 [Arachis hypogaea]
MKGLSDELFPSITLRRWQRVRKSITEEAEEEDNPTEVTELSKLTRLLGPPTGPSLSGAWARTDTSLRLGALRRGASPKKPGFELGAPRTERDEEEEGKEENGMQQQDAELIAISYKNLRNWRHSSVSA